MADAGRVIQEVDLASRAPFVIDGSAAGSTVVLTPTYTASVEWSCNGNKGYGNTGTMPAKFLPASCRPSP